MSHKTLINNLKRQQTFVMIKPDGVMRGLTGEIITRIERAGLKIVALKMTTATKEKLEAHYPMTDEAWVSRLGEKGLSAFEAAGLDPIEFLGTNNSLQIGQGVTESLVQYMTSAPVVCMVIEGVQAVPMLRKIVGGTLPSKADMGTIRGDYSVDCPTVANVEGRALHNLIHASEIVAEAELEIKIWFTADEINSYNLGNGDIMYSKHY